MFEKFLANKKPKVDESTLSAEEIKDLRRERMRRNFRILALFVAAYYFVSAGFAWYEEHEREQAAKQAAAQGLSGDAFADGLAFRAAFNSHLNSKDTALPTANANDNVEGFVAVLSPSIELRGFTNPGERELYAVQLQSRFPNGLESEALTAIKTFITTVEGSAAEVAEILEALGIKESEALLNPEYAYDRAQAQSSKALYELNFDEGPIDELTLIATPRS